MDIPTDAVDAAARALSSLANWCSCKYAAEPCADCRHEAWAALSAGAGHVAAAVLHDAAERARREADAGAPARLIANYINEWADEYLKPEPDDHGHWNVDPQPKPDGDG